MIKPLVLVFVALPMLSMIVAAHDQSKPNESAAISGTLDALHDVASKADGERYFALFAPDAVFLGTDATERWTLTEFKAYAQQRFNTGTGWTYHPRRRQPAHHDR